MSMSFIVEHWIPPVVKALIIIGAFSTLTANAQKAPESPFVPIYCEGDDLSYAKEKPKTIYKEVSGSRIEIANMPTVKDQGQMSGCRSFALGAVLQKYVCDKWKNDIPDCKNIETELAISYTGLMAFTNVNVDKPKALLVDILNKDSDSIYGVLESLQKRGTKLFTEGCISEDTLLKSFSGPSGLQDRKRYFEKLRGLYEGHHDSEPASCVGCSANLRQTLGINVTEDSLSKSFAQESYEEFLYSIFFSRCKAEAFPGDYTVYPYPLDSMNVTPTDIKFQVLKGINRGKPVLLMNLCTRRDDEGKCVATHALVISGFKKVADGSVLKEVFKVHNSWGINWQRSFNNGWVDANTLVENIARSIPQGRIPSGTVLWLE